MKSMETAVRGTLAIVLLVGDLSMLVPLAFAVVAIVHGAAIPAVRWFFPLAILGAGAALTWLLSRRRVRLQPFLPGFALWLAAAVAYWFSALR